MRLIFVILVVGVSALLANPVLPMNNAISNGNIFSINSTQNSEKEAQMTIEQYNEMMATLKNLYRMGDKGKSYIIANAYMQKHLLSDGVIKPDNKKALKWFRQSLADGFGISALGIMLLQNLQIKDPRQALNVVEKGLQAKNTDINAKKILALAYGSIVLDNFHNNEKYIKNALKIMYPVASRVSVASIDYVFANLLNLNGQTSLANKYLNSACNNPNAPAIIKNMCINGSEISVKDKNGRSIKRVVKSNCAKNQLMPELKDQ